MEPLLCCHALLSYSDPGWKKKLFLSQITRGIFLIMGLDQSPHFSLSMFVRLSSLLFRLFSWKPLVLDFPASEIEHDNRTGIGFFFQHLFRCWILRDYSFERLWGQCKAVKSLWVMEINVASIWTRKKRKEMKKIVHFC